MGVKGTDSKWIVHIRIQVRLEIRYLNLMDTYKYNLNSYSLDDYQIWIMYVLGYRIIRIQIRSELIFKNYKKIDIKRNFNII